MTLRLVGGTRLLVYIYPYARNIMGIGQLLFFSLLVCTAWLLRMSLRLESIMNFSDLSNEID